MEKINNRLLALTVCIASLGIGSTYAANVEYLWDKTKDIPGLKHFNIVNKVQLKETIPAKAQLFTMPNNVKPGLYEYRLRNAFIDREGVTHARYDEYYKGLPVLWADTVVHRKKSQSINGTLVTGLEKDLPSLTPALSKNQAIIIAEQDFIKNFAGKKNAASKYTKAELVIYPYAQNANGNHTAHLAYQINYFTSNTNNKLANPNYIIDAQSGAILQYFDNLKRTQQQVGTGAGGNTNPALTNGSYFYGGAGAPTLGELLILTDTPSAGNCTWSNRGVAAINMANATNNPSIFPILQNNEANYPAAVIPGCTAPNYLNTNDNGQAPVAGANSPDNDILYYGTQTYNLFATYSVRNPQAPFGNTNPAIRYYINLDSTDAFAQNAGCGNVPDACFNQQAVFGNGQTQMYPQVGYDVVGHETAHIYIGLTSGLVYANQSGGMNEAFADITGATLGAYIRTAFAWFPPVSSTPPLNNPLGISFWTQGALDSKTSPALRYLYNPPLDNNSIDNAANYTQGMDVHFSSGVYNKAFYNLSLALGNNALINPQAILQAYRFFVVANDTYWTANNDFFQGACGVILAANSPAHGGSRAIGQLAVNAFAGVGVRCMRGLDKIKVTN